MEDKRKYIRHYIKKPVEFAVGNCCYAGTLLNLTKGGAFIQAWETFSIGDSIALIYESDVSAEGGVKRTGTITRITKTGIGIEFERPGYSD